MLCAGAAVAAAPALASLGCGRRIAPSPALSVGAPADDGSLTLTRAQAPMLDTIGGSVVVHPQGVDPVLIFNAGDAFVAVQGLCPHAACALTWVHADKEIECPCHGSSFASDGTLINPPAEADLETYPVAVDRATGNIVARLKAGDGVFPAVAGGKVTFALSDHPELQSVGGSVTGKPEGLGRPLLVLRFSQTEVRAYDATCTHQSCRVHHSSAGHDFICPCHGSRYDETGAVKLGPAKLPLKTFAATFDGTTISVSVS